MRPPQLANSPGPEWPAPGRGARRGIHHLASAGRRGEAPFEAVGTGADAVETGRTPAAAYLALHVDGTDTLRTCTRRTRFPGCSQPAADKPFGCGVPGSRPFQVPRRRGSSVTRRPPPPRQCPIARAPRSWADHDLLRCELRRRRKVAGTAPSPRPGRESDPLSSPPLPGSAPETKPACCAASRAAAATASAVSWWRPAVTRARCTVAAWTRPASGRMLGGTRTRARSSVFGAWKGSQCGHRWARGAGQGSGRTLPVRNAPFPPHPGQRTAQRLPIAPGRSPTPPGSPGRGRLRRRRPGRTCGRVRRRHAGDRAWVEGSGAVAGARTDWGRRRGAGRRQRASGGGGGGGGRQWLSHHMLRTTMGAQDKWGPNGAAYRARRTGEDCSGEGEGEEGRPAIDLVRAPRGDTVRSTG